ncbi:restriction endonuclease [Micromonospora sp. WMMD714]|uniref:McrC family protein n=1 Tax=Micromonospora sp. WMMD714 TaxID=3016097 RepID=UPI00249A8A29|nr:restriction endonuclease [Micromonospora sp. WMMD714]WFE65134.1 restriction endonuclease [Micromonospora sp. WMMD714]
MALISLREHQTYEGEPTTPALARAMGATGLVDTALTLDGWLRLRSGSRVGAARITAGDDHLELHVRPKVGIARLLWLLGYARDPGGWRTEPVGLTADQDLVPAMAVAFATAASRALASGVLSGYRTVEEATPLVRGRIREADQLRARPGLALPVEVRYDDYVPDVPENRILLSAVRRLHRLPGVPPATRNALHRLAGALADVTPLTPGTPVPRTVPNRFTARYQPALRLARLILAGAGIEHIPGSTLATGFVFDLNTVFEDWLTTALGDALTTHYGGTIARQHPVRLDHDHLLPLVRPDITWWDGRRCLAVIDAKYKTPGSTPPRDDVYQLLAYCTTLRLTHGHLVYAATGAGPASYRLNGSGVRISVHRLDLSVPLPHLHEQVDRIAAAVVTTHRGAADRLRSVRSSYPVQSSRRVPSPQRRPGTDT